jgi:hypothetical protein
MIGPASSARQVTRRVPLGRVSPEARLVLEVESTAPAPVTRELVRRLDRVRALLCDGRVDVDTAYRLLWAFRLEVGRVRDLALAGKMTEDDALRALRRAV